MSGEASRSIEDCIDSIADQCPSGVASSQTKANALETLRKIGKSICLSVGIIPRQVRNGGATTTHLVETMRAIIDDLDVEEKMRLRPWAEEKLAELEDIGEVDLDGVGDLIDLIVDPLGDGGG